jgi:hypothetical protein
MGAKPKTVSLSDSTFLIAKKIEEQYHSGFSGWLRAMIRQWDERIDTVQLDLNYQASTLRYKTLRAAIGEMNDEIMDDIFEKYNELMTQRTLGDFE